MATAAIVKPLDVLEDGRAQHLARGPGLAVQKLGLQASKKAFGHGIVQGISHTAHGTQHPRILQRIAEGQGGVLRTVVRVMDEAIIRPAVPDGHGQRVDHQLRLGTLSHVTD